jgi:hypothetical protein
MGHPSFQFSDDDNRKRNNRIMLGATCNYIHTQ